MAMPRPRPPQKESGICQQCPVSKADAAVAIVNVDHHTTMRARTLRVPHRSAHQAVGISKRTYERLKALNTYPICCSESDRSRRISLATVEIHTRSRYVTIASATANATTPKRTNVARASTSAATTGASFMRPTPVGS